VDIDAVFKPVAKQLIDSVFPTDIVYRHSNGIGYDPATGSASNSVTTYNIKAGVLSRGRVEEGGVAETYELRLYIHHDTSGMPSLPTTADSVVYDGTEWKVTQVDPTYSSAGLIASKITARNQ